MLSNFVFKLFNKRIAYRFYRVKNLTLEMHFVTHLTFLLNINYYFIHSKTDKRMSRKYKYSCTIYTPTPSSSEPENPIKVVTALLGAMTLVYDTNTA